MSSSKTFLLFGLFVAIVLLISSEVAARELAETQTTTTNKNSEAATVDGRGGYNGGSGYHNGDGGYHGGHGGGGHGGGGHGGHGGGGHGGCHHYCHGKCCNYAGEVVDAETTEIKPHN